MCVSDITQRPKPAGRTAMRPILVVACLLLITPITGSLWASRNQMVLDPIVICKKARKLPKRMAEICKNETALLKEISRGVHMGTKECQYQFQNRPWNCTTARKSLKKVLLRDTRETGFVNAITAAGVTYAVTRACTMGDLVECSCDKITKGARFTGPRPVDSKMMSLVGDGEWAWGGCGDNVSYGYRKAKDFLDARYRKRGDIKTMVKIHNYDAGRLAVKNHMRTECKCHGLSGSCTLRTCWRKMPPFREVGNRLKEKFDGAAKVIAGNDGHSFMPEGLTIKPPSRTDLVYSEDSPDFCKANKNTGSLGTLGRICNEKSQGVDGCDLLCCGRGHHTKTITEVMHCNCTFIWCCEVKCDKCPVHRNVSTCN